MIVDMSWRMSWGRSRLPHVALPRKHAAHSGFARPRRLQFLRPAVALASAPRRRHHRAQRRAPYGAGRLRHQRGRRCIESAALRILRSSRFVQAIRSAALQSVTKRQSRQSSTSTDCRPPISRSAPACVCLHPNTTNPLPTALCGGDELNSVACIRCRSTSPTTDNSGTNRHRLAIMPRHSAVNGE
jgi:hypothetical protein